MAGKRTAKRFSLSASFTVVDLEKSIKKKDKKGLAKFVRERFSERHIDPLRESRKKNGFSMAAAACLLVETLESFHQGWEDSNGKSEKSFRSFFERETHFKLNRKQVTEFYKCVRCGILHQGEATGGWRIRRKSSKRGARVPIFNKRHKIIDAEKLLAGMEKSLEKYCKRLGNEDWDSEIWDNCRRKIRFVIKNCEG